ncbi:MAG: hypothetical protein WBB01_16795 [Phormidesmis sp.]
MTTQPAREFIDAAEFADLQGTGTVFVTERRRPLYFDGRFLTAADLTAEQTYFLGRQATLTRLSGFGVVQGLEVSLPSGEGATAFQVMIAAGCGVTPSGESVVLDADLTLNLANTARIETLDAAFGVGDRIQDPARSQTGVFILGLRLVEYSASPIASYPTSSTGSGGITAQNGEIVEATAITLARYGSLGGRSARSQIARDIFVEETVPKLPVNLLPLAMVALDRGTVQWIDNFLVRRDLGSTANGTLGLNTVPRALRSAHLLQYDQQLREVEATASAGFSAASYFDTLPAAGRVPKAALNEADFSQRYFPSEVTVELTVAPTDEIAALVEDSLALPPIDLREHLEDLETLALLMVIPLTRQQLITFNQALAAAQERPPTPSPIFQPVFRPAFQPMRRSLTLAAPGLIAKRKPLEKLARLNRFILPIAPTPDPVDSLWRNAVANAPELWYIRQRNIPYQADIVGTVVPLASDDASVESNLTDRLDSLNLGERFSDLRTSAIGRADVVSLLSAPQINRSDLLLRSALSELENAPADADTPADSARPIDRATVLGVAERFGDPRLGEGLSRLEAVAPAIRDSEAVVSALAASGEAIALDRVARTLSSAELTRFGRELTTLATGGDTAAVSSLIRNRLEGVQ